MSPIAEVTNRDPSVYLPEYEKRHSGVVGTNWIPMDPELWRIENHLDFLAERRRLLAEAANRFLDELAGGTAPEVDVGAPVVGEGARLIPVEAAEDDEARHIAACREWVVAQGLADGIEDDELVDDETGEALVILDLAWPDGMQLELTEPVALLLNEPPEVERTAAVHGFRYFTRVGELKEYARAEVLADEAQRRPITCVAYPALLRPGRSR